VSLSGFTTKAAPRQPVLQVRLGADADLCTAVAPALDRLLSHVLSAGAGIGPSFLRRADAVVGVCLPAPVEAAEGLEGAELPEGKLACAVWTGDFASVPEGLAALEAEARRQGLEPAGAPWEVPLTGPSDVARPEDARTQLYLPVR